MVVKTIVPANAMTLHARALHACDYAFAPAADRWNHRRRRENHGVVFCPFADFLHFLHEDVIRQYLAWRDSCEVSRTSYIPRTNRIVEYISRNRFYSDLFLVNLEDRYTFIGISLDFFWILEHRDPWLETTKKILFAENKSSWSLERVNCAHLRGHRSVNYRRGIYMLKL